MLNFWPKYEEGRQNAMIVRSRASSVSDMARGVCLTVCDCLAPDHTVGPEKRSAYGPANSTPGLILLIICAGRQAQSRADLARDLCV